MAHSYSVGTGAWVQDPEEGWVSATVQQKSIQGDKVKLDFEITGGSRTGEVCRFSTVHLLKIWNSWVAAT